ncbi:MAG: hypothetical protein OJF49_004558 [Ktedonobacterales bacterium]|nr:MAG: hypothetical protein OJF49_004558 [Ktedonobacterales bacterium]
MASQKDAYKWWLPDSLAHGETRDGISESNEARDEETLPEGSLWLSRLQPEKHEWLWPGRIPMGAITILDGDPGLGKSLVALDLIARV